MREVMIIRTLAMLLLLLGTTFQGNAQCTVPPGDFTASLQLLNPIDTLFACPDPVPLDATITMQGGEAPYNISIQYTDAELDTVITDILDEDFYPIPVPIDFTKRLELLEVIDANGCVATITPGSFFTINVIPIEPEINAFDELLCQNGCLELIASVTSGGTPNYSYEWLFDGETVGTGDNICASAGLYMLIVTDSEGCEAVEFFDTSPFFDILDIEISTPNGQVCLGQCVDLEATVVNGGIPDYTYFWTLNGDTVGTGSEICADQRDTYTVLVRDGEGCPGNASYAVDENDLFQDLTATFTLDDPSNGLFTCPANIASPGYFEIFINDPSFSENEPYSAVITNITSNNSSSTNYVIDYDEESYSIDFIPTQSATYVLESLTDANGCEVEIIGDNSYDVEVANLSAGPDQTVCLNQTTTLTATKTGKRSQCGLNATFNTFRWYNAAGTQIAAVTGTFANTYSVTTSPATSTTFYRVTMEEYFVGSARGGECSPCAWDDTVWVYVDQFNALLDSAYISQEYCFDDDSPKSIGFAFEDGFGPFDIEYETFVNGVSQGFTDVFNYNSGEVIPVFPTQTTSYRLNRASDNLTCDGTVITDSSTITITIFDTLRATALNPDVDTICFLGCYGLSYGIYDGANPYTIEYEVTDLGTGSSQVFVQNDYNSGEVVSTPSPLESTAYKLLRVTDANGCSAVIEQDSVTVIIEECPPPANDLCSNVIEVSCGSSIVGTIASATAHPFQPGELICAGPDQCAAVDSFPDYGPGVWYSFTGTGGEVTFSLCGSEFNTILLVFKGSCNALECVRGNDDFSACGLQSEVNMITEIGETYLIYVGMLTIFDCAGDYALSVDCNDECPTVEIEITDPLDCEGSSPPQFCPGDSVTLTAKFTSGTPFEPYTFNWSNGMTGESIVVAPTETTTYSVNYSDGVCFLDPTTAEVYVKSFALTYLELYQNCVNSFMFIEITDPGDDNNLPYELVYTDGTTIQTQIINGENIEEGEGIVWYYEDFPVTATSDPFTITILSLTDADGCQAEIFDSTVTIDINTVSLAVSDDFICLGNEVELSLVGDVNAPPSDVEFVFVATNATTTDTIAINGSDSDVVNPVETTTYELLQAVTNFEGICELLVVGEPITVQVSDLDLAVTDSQSICGGDSVTLTATPSGGNPPYTYSWSNNFTGQSQTVSPSFSQTFFVSVIDSNGCVVSDEIYVDVNTPFAVITNENLAILDTICRGEVDTLYISPSGMAPPYAIDYTDGIDTFTISGEPDTIIDYGGGFVVDFFTLPVSPIATTTYTLISASDSTGCVNNLTDEPEPFGVEFTIYVNSYSADWLIPADSICPGDPVDLSVLIQNGGFNDPPYSVLYTDDVTGVITSNNVGNPALPFTTLMPSQSTTYELLSITDANGCEAILEDDPAPTFYVHVSDLRVDAGDDVTTCEGEEVTLTAVGSGGTPPYSYFWSNDATGPSISVNPFGNTSYTVEVVDDRECSYIDTIEIHVESYSVFILQNTLNTCVGIDTFLTLQTDSLESPVFTLVYTDQTDTFSITDTATLETDIFGFVYYEFQVPISPATNTLYTMISMTNASGCDGFISGEAMDIQVNVYNYASALDAFTETICAGDTARLFVDIENATYPYTVVYTDGESLDTVLYGTDGPFINVFPTATTTYELLGVFDNLGCEATITPGSEFATVVVTESYEDTIRIYDCDAVDLTVIVDQFVTASGCDSVVTTITSPAPSYDINIDQASCDPEEVGIEVFDLSSYFGCDSTVTVNTTLVESYSIELIETSCDPDQVGSVVDTFIASSGCDSVVTTTTTLAQSYTTVIENTTCDPGSVGADLDSLISVSGCDSVVVIVTTLGETYSINVELTTCDPLEAGVSTDTLQASAGCDSIITTTTTLVDSYEVGVTVETCNSDLVGISVDTFTAATGCDSVVTTNTILVDAIEVTINTTTCEPDEAGTAIDSLATADGCDSIVTTITALAMTHMVELQINTCDPESAGTEVDSLLSSAGCDSVVTTITTLVQSYDIQLTQTTCDPTGAGISVDSLLSSEGCDSVITTTTTLLPSYTENLTAVSCDPDDVGVEIDSLVSSQGCDSIRILTIVLAQSYDLEIMEETCVSENAGIQVDSFLTTEGCDSVVTTTTVLVDVFDIQISQFSCDPNQEGVTVDSLLSADGCDSVITTTTALAASYDVALDFTTCEPSEAGMTVDSLFSFFGCDSVVTTTVALLPSYDISLSFTTCDPGEAGTVVDTFIAQGGCDSIVTTMTELNPSYSIVNNLTTCEPGSAGTVIDSFTTVAGCDSVITTETILVESYDIVTNLTTCEPDQVGTEIDSFITSEGCDSVITTITTFEEVSANLTGDAVICLEASSDIVFDITGGTGPYVVVYNDGTSDMTVTGYESGSPIQVTPSETTTYTVVSIEDATGCPATIGISSVTVEVSEDATLNVNITGDEVICGGQSTTTLVADIGTSVADTYQWSTGETTQSINVDSDGEYVVTVIDVNGCSGTDTFEVASFPLPSINIVVDNTICEGQDLTLNETGGDAVAWNWLLPDNTVLTAQSPVIPFDDVQEGEYILSVTDSNGCVSSDMVTIDVSLDGSVFTSNILISRDGCVGDTIHFIDISDTSASITAFNWDFGDGSFSNEQDATHIYSSPGTYSVQLEAFDGECGNISISKEIEIEVCRNVLNGSDLSYLNVYPNPSSGFFNLELEFIESTNVVIQLYAVNGVLIDSRFLSGRSMLETYELEAEGVYVFHIVSPYSTTSRKIVVIH